MAVGIAPRVLTPTNNPAVESAADFAAETARMRVVDKRAEDAMATYFPKSIGSLTVDRLTYRTLSKYGYTTENTLFATSTCPDEVNSKPGELVDLLKNRWGENFGLGGLAGVPFTGRAGFSAYAHHVPDGGKMFIVFAPHVGVEFDGVVGAAAPPSARPPASLPSRATPASGRSATALARRSMPSVAVSQAP